MRQVRLYASSIAVALLLTSTIATAATYKLQANSNCSDPKSLGWFASPIGSYNFTIQANTRKINVDLLGVLVCGNSQSSITYGSSASLDGSILMTTQVIGEVCVFAVCTLGGGAKVFVNVLQGNTATSVGTGGATSLPIGTVVDLETIPWPVGDSLVQLQDAILEARSDP